MPNVQAEAVSAPLRTVSLAEAQAIALATLNRNEARRMRLAAAAAEQIAQHDRYARGPGRLLCVCGYNFDPLASDWTCPHCRAAWPWRSRL